MTDNNLSHSPAISVNADRCQWRRSEVVTFKKKMMIVMMAAQMEM